MTVVFVTGLSGVGKSTTLERLKEQGHKVVDTDYGYVTTVNKDGAEEKVLKEEKMARLLSENGVAHL